MASTYLIALLDIWLRERGYRLTTTDYSIEVECSAILLDLASRSVRLDADLDGQTFAVRIFDTLVKRRPLECTTILAGALPDTGQDREKTFADLLIDALAHEDLITVVQDSEVDA